MAIDAAVIANSPSRLGHPEARFRIRAANSVPRTVRVIALDDNNEEARACRARGARPHVVFSGPADFDVSMTPRETEPARNAQQWLACVDTLPERLAEWLANPDLVVIVGNEGDDPSHRRDGGRSLSSSRASRVESDPAPCRGARRCRYVGRFAAHVFDDGAG
jgi:hypothetical protein